MRALTYTLTVMLIAAPTAYGCMPDDARWSAEVAFDGGEALDLTKLTELGIEDVNYRIEDGEGIEDFPSDEPVTVYRSRSHERVMVKVGFSPPGYDWRSLLIVLPEDMDPDAFDFAAAMQQELLWLTELGAVTGLDPGMIREIAQNLGSGVRFFTRDMAPADQGCFAPGLCVDCVGPAAYTQLPPQPLAIPAAAEAGGWGRTKSLFR